MEAGDATRGIRILGPTAVVKLGSIRQVMNQKHEIKHQPTELCPTLSVMKSIYEQIVSESTCKETFLFLLRDREIASNDIH